MAKDFEQSSKQQANAIEKRLTEEFTRHGAFISALESSARRNERAAIAEHSQKMAGCCSKRGSDAGQHRPVLERNERILWHQGIDSGAASHSPSLGREGRQAKDPVREEIGAPLRADLRPQSNRLGRIPLIVPKGY
ncbi:MbeB family mobilization protein [Klebsiella pneumoniae]|uniref:MbeB family mobilization protein n=1 Tax=Klebsiella pneumoniae TaxID=573 RepID=UPI003A5D2260